MSAAENQTVSAPNVKPQTAENPTFWVYIGTYTGAKSKGIYVCRLNSREGSWTTPALAAEMPNPSFLVAHPNGHYLYAASEVNDPKLGGGAVMAYRIDSATGKLTALNRQPSGGDTPCHVVMDKTGHSLIVANYGGGSITAFPVSSDGSLGVAASFIQHHGASVNPQRQKGPHAHGTAFDRDNHLAWVADLGLDQVLGYPIDPTTAKMSTEAVATAQLPPGSGPRHVAFHPRAHFFYVLGELDSKVSLFEPQSPRETLQPIQTISALPEDFHGESYAAELEFHPSGKFLYTSNRGHNSIAVFLADRKTGKLTWVQAAACPGKNPRHFKIDPAGRFLYAALQDSGLIVTYAIDQTTGRLSLTGPTCEIDQPVCVMFAPAR